MRIASQIAIWQFIQNCLEQNTPVGLLYVVESRGSSPGRKGFHMAVSSQECIGTIGGGIMEHKLVELCRNRFSKPDFQVRLITQYHDKVHNTDQSGMICSGMQMVAMASLGLAQLECVRQCIEVFSGKGEAYLCMGPDTINVENAQNQEEGFAYTDVTSWRYCERMGTQPRLHIIGAGHVSLALSELMSMLGFYIIVYDDRPGLNTLSANRFAQETHLVQYESIGKVIQDNPFDYVTIMTIGYRSDQLVLRQLVDKSFFYIGMLGSAQKVSVVLEELRNEGIPEEKLSRICAPIGLSIGSQTAHEIAVSIAAEIIQRKNTPHNLNA